MWHEPQPLSTALCFTSTGAAFSAWHLKQSALPAARASALPFEACGSWQERHSPFAIGACFTLPPPSSFSASWQFAQSAPPFSDTANGFALFASAWQESHACCATGSCTEALSSFVRSDECGSWHAVQPLASTG